MADSPCLKNRSLKADGRLNRWPLKAGCTVVFISVEANDADVDKHVHSLVILKEKCDDIGRHFRLLGNAHAITCVLLVTWT